MSAQMSAERARVVVTGLGAVSPLGIGIGANWESLLAGRSGIGPITAFDPSALPVQIAGEVRGFDPGVWLEKKEIKKVDRFAQFAIAAAQMAVDDAALRIVPAEAGRVGVVVGVGLGGLATLEEFHKAFLEGGLKRLSPFVIPRVIANMAPGLIAIRFGCTGVNYTPTSACASGGQAVGEAFRLVRDCEQDVVICGGAEATITPLGVGSFAVMRAMSTRNAEPTRASRPFDRDRDGFVIGEGAGVLVVESLARARARGVRIYAELIGYGANCDAYHITSPAPDGRGAAECMRLALASAGIARDEVDYINAHGTATPYNDANETQAIKQLFGAHAARLAVSSTKSMTGHLFGGAGGVEAVFTTLTLHNGVIPPTINLETPDPECDLDYVPNTARPSRPRVALSNSFGFGGANACVVFRRWEE
jgi:3-oxoacyl-[acyl-carrier-protein] synthase II